MGQETLYRCDVCGQVTAPDDLPPELAELLAALERAAAAAHRDALADERGPAPAYAQDRLVCRRCWPTRPVIFVQVRPHGVDRGAPAQEVSR
jgi:hypothetical protein